MARTNVTVKKPSVGIPSALVPMSGLQTAPAVGAAAAVASSRRVPVGVAASASAGVAVGQSSTGTSSLLLHVHSSGRYLATPTNTPVFLVGDTAWSLPLGLTEAEAQTYMNTRAAQGFNTIFMDTVGLKGIVSGVSTDRNGNAPFNGTLAGGQYDVSTVPAAGDVSTTSAGRYWTHIDNLLTMAQNLNLQVVLDPFDTYCPWFSSDPANFITDGHSPNSVAKLTAYGAFLGQRYVNRPNIQWVVGNDYAANATGNTNIAAVIDGIRQFDTVHTMSLEMNPPNNGDPVQAFGNATLRSRLNVNGLYEYNSGPYRTDYLAAYNRSDFGPTMNLETGYELNSGVGSTPATVRAGHYVMLLAGSCGDIYGNERVGGAGFGTDAGPWASDWVAQLNSQGGHEMGYFATFLASIAWYTLVPDQTGTVFVGVGSPTDYSGARALDGTLAVAYKVPTGGAAPAFTVNRDRMALPFTARWFDPTAGTFTTIGTGIANTGQQVFTAPGNNSAGTNDWVLVLTSSAPSAFFSLPTQADEQSFYDNVAHWTWTAGQKVTNFASSFTFWPQDIHNGTEGDDIYTHLQQWLRTGQAVFLTWATGIKNYFTSGTYETNLEPTGPNGVDNCDQNFGFDHLYLKGLVLWWYLFGETAALNTAVSLLAHVSSVTPGTTALAYYGSRRFARQLEGVTHIAQVTGNAGHIATRNNLIDGWTQSPDWQVGFIGGNYFCGRDQMQYFLQTDVATGNALYDGGLRLMSTFQIGCTVSAFWMAYLATVNTDPTRAAALRAKLEQMAWWVYKYAVNLSWVNPMSCADIGEHLDSTFSGYQRDNDSGNANLNSVDPVYSLSLVNALVIGYKFTGHRPLLNFAQFLFRKGTSWAAGPQTGRPKQVTDTQVAHYVDTLSSSPDENVVFDYNKGELQYVYLLFENGGNPTVIDSLL